MSAHLPEGTLFAARYRILRCIASGGMGTVYEAVHLETERRRALKVMHPHLFQSEDLRDRFKREARIAAQIESEHIVDVSDAGVDDATGMPFLVMELLRGEELGQRIKRLGPLPPAEALTYLTQAALALDKTHAASIVHRDLKPENLFITQREDGSPRLKILDFGIAKLIREGNTGGPTQSLGTPLYMAPEQFRVGTRLTPAADVYALGLMAYTMLVGRPYWSHELRAAGDVIAFVMVAVQGPTEPATRRAAASGVALSPAFDPWFATATAVDPAARYQTAGQAISALRQALETAPEPVMTALPPSFTVVPSATPAPIAATTTASAAISVARPAPNHRWILAAAAASAAIAILGIAVLIGLRSPSAPTAAAAPAASSAPASAPAPTSEPTPSAAPAPPEPPTALPAAPPPSSASATVRPAPSPPPPQSKPSAAKPPGKPRAPSPSLIGRD